MGGAGGGAGQSGTSDIGPPDSGAGDANSGPIGDMTGTTAITVDAFLNSMGVSSHVGIGLDAPAESTTAISYLGVRNIRENRRLRACPIGLPCTRAWASECAC